MYRNFGVLRRVSMPELWTEGAGGRVARTLVCTAQGMVEFRANRAGGVMLEFRGDDEQFLACQGGVPQRCGSTLE